MRFMIIVKASKDSEAGVLPDAKALTEMGRFNEELEKAGVLLAGEGVQASSKGARVKFSRAQRTVTDGPFTETKELVAGEAEDFGPALTPEIREQEERLRARAAAKRTNPQS